MTAIDLAVAKNHFDTAISILQFIITNSASCEENQSSESKSTDHQHGGVPRPMVNFSVNKLMNTTTRKKLIPVFFARQGLSGIPEQYQGCVFDFLLTTPQSRSLITPLIRRTSISESYLVCVTLG